MISSISGLQPPQSLPALHSRLTSAELTAPSRTALRMSRSLSPLQ